jgi:hypothetical protein
MMQPVASMARMWSGFSVMIETSCALGPHMPTRLLQARRWCSRFARFRGSAQACALCLWTVARANHLAQQVRWML